MTSSSSPSAVKVLFVAGTGRSGTTILSSILAQLPGVLGIGELRYVWERGFEGDHRCGCGEPFSRCPLWTQVVAQAYPDGPPDPAAVSTDLLDRLRMLRIPSMLARQVLGREAVPANHHDIEIGALYRALDHLEHPSVIIDSSKLPPYGKLLQQLPGIDLYVVHLVRDPRANAFSWQRIKKTRDRDDDAVMERLELWRSAAMWVVWNYVVGYWWPRRDPRYLRLRYEDFVDHPRRTVEQIATMLDLDTATLPFVDEQSVRMQPVHSVAGNPNRHDRGVAVLRRDDQWIRDMPRWQQTLVTVMTLPGLRHFGYPVRSAPGDPDPGAPVTSRRVRES